VVRGKDRKGKAVRFKAEGVQAHILQHEIDHLDGVLYIDYLDSMDELRPSNPKRRRRRAAGADDEPDDESDVDVIQDETETPAESLEPTNAVFDPCCSSGRCSRDDRNTELH
jgi:hypothetical protein